MLKFVSNILVSLYQIARVHDAYGFVEDPEPVYVDVRACLETFSKELIKINLSPPTVNTVFLDLVRFTPGSPEKSANNSSPSNSQMPSTNGRLVAPTNGHLAPVVTRPREDHSMNLARAIVGPNEHSLSPRGVKRRLDGEDDRDQPQQRARISYYFDREPHNDRHYPQNGTSDNVSSAEREDTIDSDISIRQFPTPRNESPNIRKIKLFVNKPRDEASS